MDGALAIDKPVGPTSHDIVARVRRLLGERRIGHTGTLDPLASGLLVLVLGRATRLARFLTTNEKSYDAQIRLGFTTDTYDALGTPTSAPHSGPWPPRDDVERALDAFRGTFLQQPPAYSAKKIDGQRSYKLARARRVADSGDAPRPGGPADSVVPAAPVVPAAASVTAYAIDVTACDGDTIALRVDCSSGFYIRSLAHDLGQRLGTGAHLTALRRTRNGAFTLASAVSLEALEHATSAGVPALIPLAGMLPHLAAVALTAEGVAHVTHGRDVGPGDVVTGSGIGDLGLVRLLDDAGDLIALAEPVARTGLLHPSVVLR